ncbi:hypothetical protein ACVW1C_005848 [Bradyrhizobium sp. USDA 4011]
MVSFDQGEFDACQMVRGGLWRRIAQRDHFERCARLGDLPHRVGIERSNSDAAAGPSYDKMLGLQLPKGLAHRGRGLN